MSTIASRGYNTNISGVSWICERHQHPWTIFNLEKVMACACYPIVSSRKSGLLRATSRRISDDDKMVALASPKRERTPTSSMEYATLIL